MLKSLVKLANRNSLKTLGELTNQLMICITLSDRKGSASAKTLQALLVALNNFASPFNNLRVNDDATCVDDRVMAGSGYFFPIFAGCRIAVKVECHDVGENACTLATMYIPPQYRNRIDEILLDINPIDYTLPRIYTFAANENVFNGRVEVLTTETFTGYLELHYATQHQLIDPEHYDSVNRVFKRFTTRPDWYREVGRAHKETFLIYGPPGTGKTNLARHFAAKYRMNMVLAAPGRNLNALRTMLATALAGKPTMILFEDIHSHRALREPEEGVSVPRYGLSDDSADFSEFLNFLDGPRPLKNVIVVMTTNEIHKLKDGIYRSGRVNHLMELGYPSQDTF